MSTARSSRRPRGAALLAAGVVVASAMAASAQTGTHRLRFGAPVRLTQFGGCGSYEPGVLVDRFGNIVVTAHKQNHCDAGAVDPQGEAVAARAMSWVWLSSDGEHFRDMPGTDVAGHDAVDRMDVGDEGHLAQDDHGNIYFADLKLADDTFVSWHASGRGKVVQTSHSPVVVTAQPVDDRPWVAAHGNGVVLLASNSGSGLVYSSPANGGKGRYTIYMSRDGGASFDHLGITIPDSGWCYPAADHRPGSRVLFVACTNDNGKLFAYVSRDDGKTWTSRPIAKYASLDSWPVGAVGPDGAFYVLHLDREHKSSGPFHLILFRSRNLGRTWDRWDATPRGSGTFDSINGAAWLDVSRTGEIGITYYLLPQQDTYWHVYAGLARTWRGHLAIADASGRAYPGTKSAGGEPWGDFLSCAFGPDNRLHVVWTTPASLDGVDAVAGLNSDIYYSEQAR